ncbi:MAG TPA: hypothetical protein VGA34_03160 [Alteraurantiacibacter sp.]
MQAALNFANRSVAWSWMQRLRGRPAEQAFICTLSVQNSDDAGFKMRQVMLRHYDLLRDTGGFVADPADYEGRPLVRLMFGPVDRSKADRICTALNKRGQDCFLWSKPLGPDAKAASFATPEHRQRARSEAQRTFSEHRESAPSPARPDSRPVPAVRSLPLKKADLAGGGR